MPFTPQPYPLFAAFYENNKPAVARIIGWVSPDGDSIDPSAIQAVAIQELPGGDVTEPKYLDFEHEEHWVGGTGADALNQLKRADP